MIILDTHVWLWLLHNPEKLSPIAQRLIAEEEAKNGLLVSAISVWEISVKVSLGKLDIPVEINDWYQQASAYPGLFIEPVTPADFIASTQLIGNFHKDPSDRIIVAFARRLGVSLISCDAKIINYPYVETIW
jgi:PIN domain nuclease of toxin-antitoxin system